MGCCVCAAMPAALHGMQQESMAAQFSRGTGCPLRRKPAVLGMLIPVFGYKAICSIMCLTSSMILVNVTAPMDQACTRPCRRRATTRCCLP